MHVIIFEKNGKTAVLTPTPECLEYYSIQQIADKDVPHGVPYWIVDSTSLPSDVDFFDAWELDTEQLGEPAGTGSEFDYFVAETQSTEVPA